MVVQLQKRCLLLTYLKLGYLLHLMTLAELVIIYYGFQYFNIGKWLQSDFFLLKSFLLTSLIVAPIFPQCDARSRFQNYKQVKDHLYLNGFQPRIIKPFSFSRCQRDAVLAAAEELGMAKECKQYFKNQGYRWYHVLPEFIFHRPHYIFHKAFWLNTFFAKYYPAKFDFTATVQEEKISISEYFSFTAGSII